MMARRAALRKTMAPAARPANASLLDIVDNVLHHGVVLDGDLVLGVANVDLIYARLSLLLSSIDHVSARLKPPSGGVPRRKS